MTLIWVVKYRYRAFSRWKSRTFTDIVEANDFAKHVDANNVGFGNDPAEVKLALKP